MKFCLQLMSDTNKERERNNKLKDSRGENQEEAREATTQNRWRGFGVIFNSLTSY